MKVANIFQILVSTTLSLSVSIAAQIKGKTSRPPVPQSSQVEDQAKQAETLYEQAQAFHQKNDLQKAISLYQQAMRLDSTLWQAEFQLSLAYLSLQKLPSARAAINNVLGQLKEYGEADAARQMQARALLVSGDIALAEKDFKAALDAFQQAKTLAPQNARAMSGLAESFLLSGKPTEAAAEAKLALASGDDRANTLSVYVDALLATKQYEPMIAVLTSLIQKDSRNVVALRMRAEAFIATQHADNAMMDLRAALAIQPEPQSQARLAGLLAQTKQYEEAIALYQQILQAEPANREARNALTALLIDTGKSEESVVQLEALVQAEPQRADLRAQLGDFYRAKQPDKALEQYLLAARLEPKQPRHALGAASVLVKQRRFTEAFPLLQYVLSQNPAEDIAYVAHTNLGTAYFEMNDFQNAAREFNWIAAHPQDQKQVGVALYFLGICFDKLGELEQAEKVYQRFLSVALPENQLEIDKVKLRMPSLQRQLKEGKGKRKK